MKTRLRTLLSGDFLYLDGDLVIRGDIEPIWHTSGDVAGVLDRNLPFPYFAPIDKKRFAFAGWSLPNHGLINGGVVFWRDTEAGRALGIAYHQRWLEMIRSVGRSTDQQALNKAIDDCQVKVELMPYTYNCMERYHPREIADARVWHFLFSNADTETNNDKTFWEAVVRGHQSEPMPVQWARQKHPWLVRDPVGWVCLHALRHSRKINYIKDWRRLWLLGERARAIKALLSPLIEPVRVGIKRLKSG